MILALQTTTFSAHGGIPAYNRMVCRALNELDDLDLGERLVLIAMDRQSDIAPSAGHFPNLTLEAFAGNRVTFVRRVLATALRKRIDLALIGHVNHAPLGIALKRIQPGLRYGVITYGVDVWSRLSGIKRLALQRADFVASISEYTRNQIVEVQGVPRDRVHVLPKTIDWLREETKPGPDETWEAPALPEGIRLLSVCRLEATERYKGVDTVIAALPTSLKRVPDLQYIVVGSGSDLNRHKRLAVEAGVADRVHFLGSVDDATLRHCYQSCDIFALPSDGEGFGIVYLEAAHYGKPVIAANSRAVPEVVTHNETGLLVDYGNVEQLAEAISVLCLNVGLREKFGRAGRDRLRQEFTFDLFKEKLHEIVLSGMPETVSNTHVVARGVASTDG